MKMLSATLLRPLTFATITAAVLLISGCGIGTPVVDGPEMLPGADIAGLVRGGQNPVTSSNVALFATGPTAVTGPPAYTPPNAYGSTPYFLASTTTDSNGNFNFAGTTYTCPSGDDVYIIATGGDPGLSPTTTDNSAIFLVAALGTCANLSSIPTININEATTVAAAYALSGFAPAGGAGMTEAAVKAATVASPGAGITSTTTNNQGLLDAFSNALNIANIQTGTIYATTPTGGTVTTNIAYALADILQDCVNSSGPSSTPCTSLFAAATPPGTSPTVPVNSWQAALNIAQYPGNQVGTLFGLISAQAAFPESLTTAPNDWTIGVTYTNSTLSGALGMAIDANDNVWVTGSVNADLMEFSPVGKMLSPAMPSSGSTPTGAVGPQGGWVPTYYQNPANSGTGDNWRYMTFDKSGNGWLADGAATNPPSGDAYVYEYSPAGTNTTPTQGTMTPRNYYTVDENVNTYAIAADKYGDIWTATYKKAAGCTGSTSTSSKYCAVVEMVPTSYTPYATFSTSYTDTNFTSQNGSRSIAVDSTNGNVWTTDIGASKAYLFKTTLVNGSAATATANTSSITLGTGSDITWGVAVDSGSNAWVVASTTGGLYKISSTGSAGSEITGGGLSTPAYDVVDGNNNIFVANGSSSSATYSSIVEYNTSLSSFVSPNVGFAPGSTYVSATTTLSGNSIYQPSNVAVDRSGALWTLSTGTGTSPSLSNLVQILGVAAPTDPVLADGVYGTKP